MRGAEGLNRNLKADKITSLALQPVAGGTGVNRALGSRNEVTSVKASMRRVWIWAQIESPKGSPEALCLRHCCPEATHKDVSGRFL